jgi:hypothetical protein
MPMTSAQITRTRRWVLIGMAGGVLGAMVMAAYAMIVSGAYKEVGYLTPLYHIASAFIAPDAMMRSMEQAAAGDAVSVDGAGMAVGALVHMLSGAAAGAAFGALASFTALRRGALVAAGALWGLVVLAGSALVGLPLTAALFGGGDAISDMPSMAGWGTFTVEHLLFGLVLGLVLATVGDTRRRTQHPAPEVGEVGEPRVRS